MICAEFYKSGGLFGGFEISGHSGYAESGEDIVCASVSSAVQLIVNILDESGCNPSANAVDNTVSCSVRSSEKNADVFIRVFRNHLESILEEFPDTIKITISEV
ncbi:MAG: ribosomal-processing cysteine protease Prp [Ruminococcus sp.]|nr:ribosomal-processing cysteine protease Prp [Ruminococcus sp.]